MATILITGGTGLIGRLLTRALADRGDDVIILTRDAGKAPLHSSPRVSYASWNVQEQTIDADAISSADYIIHLAGANVGEKKWTKKRKQEIVSSRVMTGEMLVQSLTTIPNKVKAVISSSATGWYGRDPLPDGNKKGFTEEAPPADDFLGTTCRQWEAAIEPVAQLNKRLVIFRAGPVLSKQGGMLREFMKPLRFGIAPILGSGKQMISWIHITDMVRLYITAIENDQLSGVYNATATHPVSNKEMMLAIARVSRGKFFIPVYTPSFALKLFLGEMSEEVLKSATVSCEKIHHAGFVFQYPDITAAVMNLVKE